MTTWEAADLAPYQQRMLDIIRRLRLECGLSPRSGLSEQRLLQSAIARALRSQSSCRGDLHSEEFLAWLDALVQLHVVDEWNLAVSDYCKMLLGYARFRWPSWDLPASSVEPEDMVNSAWEKARRSHSAFNGQSEGEYVVWLQKILVSVALDERDRLTADKRNWRKTRSLDAEIEAASARLDQFLQAVGQATPSLPVRWEEFRARVYAEIELLPAEERAAVILYLQDRKPAQIAVELNTPIMRTRRVLQSAFGTLRRRLDDMKGGWQ